MNTITFILWGLAFVLLIGIPVALVIAAKRINFDDFPAYKATVPQYLRDQWESQFITSVLFEYYSYFIVPIACLFIYKEARTDKVKRLSSASMTLQREYLHPLFRWWNTHDNAMDEGYWGWYSKGGGYGEWTFGQYHADTLAGKWRRYYWRVWWGWRNVGYTFLYEVLGQPHNSIFLNKAYQGVEDSGNLWYSIQVYDNWFQYEAQIPNGAGEYQSVNFGWKQHRSAPIIEATSVKNVMYANRVLFNTKSF